MGLGYLLHVDCECFFNLFKSYFYTYWVFFKLRKKWFKFVKISYRAENNIFLHSSKNITFVFSWFRTVFFWAPQQNHAENDSSRKHSWLTNHAQKSLNATSFVYSYEIKKCKIYLPILSTTIIFFWNLISAWKKNLPWGKERFSVKLEFTTE